MTKVLKRLDLLIREVKDPHAQENFWRLKRVIEDIEQSGLAGPAGPQGPIGPSGTTASSPKLIATFTTDVGTLVNDLVRVNGDNTVTKISDNFVATIPNGVFGVGVLKPTALQIEVLFCGIVSGYSGFTIGLPLFISTTGVPSHTVPATGMVQQIGFAISATEMFVNLMQPMRRA